MLYQKHDPCEIDAAVDLALQSHISSSEGVRHLLIYVNEPRVETAPLEGWNSIPTADIHEYDQLGGMQ
jgi:hypothetical protein